MTSDAAREQPTVGRSGVLAKIGDLSSLTGKDAVRLFDEQVDALFAPFRGVPSIDAAARVISGLGDHGLVWAVSTAWRARRSGARRNRAVRALAVAGVESSVVNAALKAFVGRPRPDPSDLRLGDNVIPLREPRTSSFPSGHTLAAFCAATVLSERGDRGGNALLFACAGLVGVSRIHLQAHHASDVLGGVVIGTALGAVGRRFV
ncbi:MAG TPA: phosphatase PAP2 family protein [Acidimicrobiales bacterium]|nr:phosphatase PAP2 family protein [Acidimicrobiales bacterium]